MCKDYVAALCKVVGGLARSRTRVEVALIGKSNSRLTRKEGLTRARPGRQRKVKMTSQFSCACSWRGQGLEGVHGSGHEGQEGRWGAVELGETAHATETPCPPKAL